MYPNANDESGEIPYKIIVLIDVILPIYFLSIISILRDPFVTSNKIAQLPTIKNRTTALARFPKIIKLIKVPDNISIRNKFIE